MDKVKVILDTDIGDDIDDALALGLLIACPEFELLGVTTVFGNVIARARQARTILKCAGEKFATIPVAAGCGASMASRPLHNIESYLKDVLPNQDSTCFPESQLHPLDKRHGVNFLIDTIMNGNGDIVPITIGALTNLAAAIVLERRIVAKIPKLLIMAGGFERHTEEWNIKCDPEGAHIVFSTGIPADIIPWEVGKIVSFNQNDIDRLAASNRPMAQRLSLAIHAWQTKDPSAASRKHLPALYDPMTIVSYLNPDLVSWKTGTVSVELAGSTTYAYTKLKEDPKGPHRYAFAPQRDACIELYLDRVTKF